MLSGRAIFVLFEVCTFLTTATAVGSKVAAKGILSGRGILFGIEENVAGLLSSTGGGGANSASTGTHKIIMKQNS